MIYITGDTHGSLERFSEVGMKGESTWTADDKVIICGDFSFIWYDEDNKKGKEYDNKALDILAQKPYEILFIDGNHENFNELYSYPQVERYGDKVHKIRDNIYHLQRGRIYKIEGKSFFTFGGAYSIDKYRRQENISWWSQESPNEQEYARAEQALAQVNYKVDYIITHTAPAAVIEVLMYLMPYEDRINYTVNAKDYRITNFLNEKIWFKASFKHWYFGHWHLDKQINNKATALLSDVIKID